MPLLQQVFGRKPTAALVVEHHDVGVDPGRRPVDEHHRHARAHEERVVALVRHDHQPRDLPADQLLDRPLLPLRILVDTSEYDGEPGLPGDLE